MSVPRLRMTAIRRSSKGYTTLCISLYADDVRRADRLIARLGGSRSSVIRDALRLLEENLDKE